MSRKRSRVLTEEEINRDIDEWLDESEGNDDLCDLIGEVGVEEITDVGELPGTMSDDDESAPVLDPPRRHKKLLTKNRIVNNIDTAIDDGNYNDLVYLTYKLYIC